jgi:hypothetical protein
MIQGVISRMSGFRATAKIFAVTVLVALVAVAFDRGAHLLWTGIGALASFLAMDFYYHLLEVRFRELYRTTALSPLDPPSDMLLDAPPATGAHAKKVLKSRTLLPFYVLLLFAFVIALYEAAHVSPAKLESNGAATRDSGGPSGQIAPSAERTGGTAVRAETGADKKRAGGPTRHLADTAKH